MNVLTPQPLPSLFVGEKRIRFLYLMGEGQAAGIGLQVSSGGGGGIQLFLAADVLADSNILKENQPRLHARFAKKGLAIKLNFQSNLKLEGIHGIAKGIWFYSIQGVFRVVFEFLDRTKQLDCLNSLTGLWQSSYHDPLLSPSTTVHMQLSLPHTHASMDVHESVRPEMQGCVETSQILSTGDCAQNVEYCRLQASVECQEVSLGREQDCQVDRDSMESGSTLNLGSVVSVQTASQDSTDADHVSEMDPTCITLKACCNDNDHQVQVLPILQRLVKDYCQPGKESFPLDLLHNFYFVSQNSTTDIPDDDDDDDYWSDEHQVALCIISKWLGKQFHKYGPTISTHVEEFKSKNIDHIDNLPPAGKLVRSLFPPAMRCLLMNWMGIGDASQSQTSETNDTHDESDVEKIPQTSQLRTGEPRSKVKRHMLDSSGESHAADVSHLYPLMQIVLEFANQTLISGVAHVLYTRLIH